MGMVVSCPRLAQSTLHIRSTQKVVASVVCRLALSFFGGVLLPATGAPPLRLYCRVKAISPMHALHSWRQAQFSLIHGLLADAKASGSCAPENAQCLFMCRRPSRIQRCVINTFGWWRSFEVPLPAGSRQQAWVESTLCPV